MKTSTTHPGQATPDTTPASQQSAVTDSPDCDSLHREDPDHDNPDRDWPGTREWTDEDYQLFVHLYSQDRFPEIKQNPVAWDVHWIEAGNRYGGDPCDACRPTVISSDDYKNHVPESLKSGPGMLVVKLWEVARAKGYTATFERQLEEARKEMQRIQDEADKEKLRQEIEDLKDNLPAPKAAPATDPHQQWYANAVAGAPPESPLADKVRTVQKAVIEGQPFRNSLLSDEATTAPDQVFGPLMLPESTDALANPFPPEKAAPVPRRWTPESTTRQIVNGAARDVADLVSLLIARQKLAVGFAPDHNTIGEVRQLTRSLRELNQIIKDTEPRKPGPKPKTRLPGFN